MTPGLDVVNFYEQVVFSYLTGHADMHLKNFSLITKPGLGPVLSPAYDMLCTAIVNPADDDLTLTLNGKKKKTERVILPRHSKLYVWAKNSKKTSSPSCWVVRKHG